MSMLTQPTTDNSWREFWTFTRDRITRFDRPAWQRFLFALFGLTLSFFLAVYSTALSEMGRVELAAWTAALALLLTGIVAAKVVPYLARRTAIERWMVKVEYKLTREGLVYLLVIAVIAVAALNTGNNLLFIVLASLLAGILVSGFLSKAVLSGLELDFILPDHIFAGRSVSARLTVVNLKWLFPSFSLTVSSRETRKGKGSKAAAPAPSRILREPVYIPYVPRRASVGQNVDLTFPRRGRYTQDGFRVTSKFPFGFLLKARELSSRKEIVVFPNVEPTRELIEILPLVGGEMESFEKGRGHDLYAIRDYQESDTARHVDWKATAKTQQLKVREFTREDEQRIVLALDRQLPRADEATLQKFERAINLCACLAWHFHESEAQVQFLTQGFETPMGHAREVIYPVLESLAVIESKVESAAESDDLLSQIASTRHGFKVVLTSRPRGSIPANRWGACYFIFIDEL